ncbi:GntR family transcriptional regulator [Labrys monachus]|uniref:DNA-binding LacI/PurR family transcriptional regulator n=1 Tax=Labrys monachus TaxID=217067 RepID=A0ABU0FCB2_9HYPH|nr:GntR family transcriptional regulator [Labrys monachus]MDQ0392071.1 DNA-binding LacI/PurR family transcriptional regulator [Labrys monachus]
MRQGLSVGANVNIVEELRRMADGLPVGSRLPTVRDLVARYGVSQHVVQQALQALSADGVVATHVGRGTFVGPRMAQPGRVATRQVLTLLHHSQYERGDIIAQTIHQRLTADGHTSVVLTYNDAEHAMAMLRDGPRYDSCILQPRTSVIPVRLLGLLREISNGVIIENRAVDQIDVDAISNDPSILSRLVLEHLTELGHRRIAWVVEDRPDYFYERVGRLFEAFRFWRGLSQSEAPLVFSPSRGGYFGFADLVGTLSALFRGEGGPHPTAVVLLSFETGARILEAFEAVGLSMPGDVSVVRIGTPDIESEHLGKLAVAGRPSRQAAETVLKRLYWRWQNPADPYGTVYDPPVLDLHDSTGPAPQEG